MPVVRFGAQVASLGMHFYRGFCSAGGVPGRRPGRPSWIVEPGRFGRYRFAREGFDTASHATGWEPFAEGPQKTVPALGPTRLR
jgi:hypothetical protein